MTEEDRQAMVGLITDLHRLKDYKVESLHLAISVADRYLASLAARGACCPNLTLLATISVLIAAKLEQPISPSFNRMINLLSEEQKKVVNKSELIRMERMVLRELEFSMHRAGPIPFLERFQRLLDLDQEKTDKAAKQVGFCARQFLKFTTMKSEYLDMRPSLIAAASLNLSINLSMTSAAEKVGLK